MGLKDFLYRCPFCGHDPLEGKGRIADCPSCSRRFEPAGHAFFRVSQAGRESFEISGHELAKRIAVLDGPLTRAQTSDGSYRYSSAAAARFSVHEQPLKQRGALLGFIERYGSSVQGTFELASNSLHFRPVRGQSWFLDLLDVRALQASSSSVQISHGEKAGGVVSFRFEEESAYRWEDLLKARLREVWSEAGRGRITEFQPRIRCE